MGLVRYMALLSAVDPKSLPVRDYANRIVEAVRSNPVTIVIGETGSGKTTQISQVRSIETELSSLSSRLPIFVTR